MVIVVAWTNGGLSLWTVFGSLLMCSLGDQPGTPSPLNPHCTVLQSMVRSECVCVCVHWRKISQICMSSLCEIFHVIFPLFINACFNIIHLVDTGVYLFSSPPL